MELIKLSPTFVHYSSKIFKLPFLKNYDAITLPWGIYIKVSKELADPTILNHEAVHMEQRAKMGTFPFYVRYLGFYFKNLWKFKNHTLAYRNIPFEVEAYAREKEQNWV